MNKLWQAISVVLMVVSISACAILSMDHAPTDHSVEVDNIIVETTGNMG